MPYCPACHSQDVVPMFDMGFQPLSLVELRSDPEESHNLDTYAITLSICRNCTHVHNIHFNPSVARYDTAGCRMFNDGSNWKTHLDKVRSLLHGISDLDLIVEIGAGDCEFLASLDTRAVHLAVDPCADVERAAELGLQYDRALFDATTHIPTGSHDTLVIMRHLLEHLEEPRLLLEDIAKYAYGRDYLTWVYIEVPSCEKALQHARVEDWTYEHPQHFTVKSLRALLHACDFDFFQIQPMYNGEVLGCLVKIEPRAKHLDDIRVDRVLRRFNEVKHGISNESGWMFEHLDNIAFWGGAGKSAMFLHLFDIPNNAVVVDSHEAKQGLYVPGTRIEIRSPEYLKQSPVDYIIATTSWRALDIRDEINQRNIPCKGLFKFEDGILHEVPLGQ